MNYIWIIKIYLLYLMYDSKRDIIQQPTNEVH